MKKSKFYFSVSQALFAAGMLSAPVITKYPLFIIVSTLMMLVGSQQLITYKQLFVLENKISGKEAAVMIRKQTIVVRIMQVCILITAVLIMSQTFHKIKL